MCGICGFNGSDRELIKKMTDVITHRGPDKEGFYVDEHVSLGNRRLSIIDLSERATQPIFNEDKSIAIVYNGEIYNFPELRKELELKGHRFYTNTDTEVVVHSYEEYGVDCLKKFNGMFAFALWDSRKKELFIARDRIGIKPLYYYYDGSKFSFASEIKAILEDSSIPREVNYLSLYYYLGYEFVPSPLTMFKRIFKLEPGNYLLYRDGRIHIKRYWELEFNPEWKKKSDYIERMRELVDLSVRRRLISDVPLGVFLSGGLDSSTVVAFMRKHITGNLKAFSIGYEDKSFSELDYATYIAREFGLEHHILMINEINPDLIEK
ncbi:MAG: asparagine synthase (glutamine-hydrolyzing), partial [Synergistetes bacterium]|nr:asparagine synthase (glutamine-hydrolyzing) [Synergistota bacterium]